MEQKPLESFFDEEETVTEAVEDTGPPRDEHGRFAAKDTGVEPQDEDPAPSEPPSDKLPPETFKGLKEEREKRQRLEQELEALKQQIQAVQNPPEPPAPPPSVWEDEQAYGGHLVSTAVQQATLNAKLDMSEMMARQNHPDFDDMKPRFLQMAQSNPALAQQCLNDPHPWNKAYQIAKNAATMEELGATDIEALRAKIREEELAKLQAEAPRAPSIPQSLTTARNVAPRSGPAWSGPTSLQDLLG